MKKIILALLLLAAAGVLFWRYGYSGPDGAAGAGSVPERRTARAGRGDIEITVSASGRIEPEREVEIKSKASGEVVKILVDVSDEVRQGMLLFKLDPVNEERSVARIRANLAMSEAKLAQVKIAVEAAEAKLRADAARAEADLKSAEAELGEYTARLQREQRLFEQKVTTREALDSAVTRKIQAESAWINAGTKMDDLKVQALELERTRQEIAIATAQVDLDAVALADAEQRLKETEVFSPISGVVSNRTIQEGFIVASGVSNVGGGTTAMKIIDLSRIYAIAAVDEADIRGVLPGVEAVVTADAYKGVEFPGKVVRVATTGVVESNVVTFDVKVEVTGPRKKLLKPEMTTNVLFRVDSRRDAIHVPAGAVVRKAAKREGGAGVAAGPDSGGGQAEPDYSRRQSFVTLIKPGGIEEERQVEVGITDGYQIEIVSGLSEGDEVLLLQNGDDNRWAGRPSGPGGPPGMRR
jgi:HlyD family secretion protein